MSFPVAMPWLANGPERSADRYQVELGNEGKIVLGLF